MKIAKYRSAFQIFFILLTLYILILIYFGKNHTAHEFCPYSSVCFGTMFFNNNFGKLLFPTAVVTGLTIALSSLFLGRKFCGYICPIGTIQEGMGLLKNHKKNYKTMKYLSLIKYPIFLLSIYFAYSLTLYRTIYFCPVYSLAHIRLISIGGILVLFTIFVISIFIDRFFCRVLCPYAAFMNILQYIGNFLHIPRFKIIRKDNTCKKCDLCSSNCPMGIEVSRYDIISDPECIHCEKCITVCLIDNALKNNFTVGNKK